MAFTSKVLALVARVLGKKYNVKIAMGNYSTAATDGETIFLPTVEGEAAVEFARGYIDHEAAHIRLTDFNIMPSKDFKGELLNIIEDIRIEKAIGKYYPGCASNLRKLWVVLNEKYGVFQPNPVNPSSSVLAWISCRGRVDTLSHDSMIASAESSEPGARAIFGNYFAEAQRLVAMIKTLPEDKSGTKAASDLRYEFMSLLEQAKEDIDNPPPPPTPEEEPEKEEKEDEKQEPSSSDQPETGESETDEEKGDSPEETDDQEGEEQDDEGSSPSDPDSEKEPDSDSESETDPTDGDADSDSKDEEDSEQKDESGSDSEPGDDPADTEGGDEKGDGESEAGSDSETGGDPAENGEESETGGEEEGGSNGKDDADGSTEGQGGSQGDTAGDDSGESQSQNGGTAGGHGSEETKAITAALEEALGDTEMQFGDIGELLKELINELAANKGSYVYDGIPQAPMCVPHPLANDGSVEFGDLNQLKTHTAKLRAQLSGLVQASKLKRSVACRSGRKIDNRILSRIRVGDDRLFIRHEEKKGVDTAVLLIMDGSGSMDRNTPGTKMYTATRSCYIALDAMYSIPGVTAAAIEFNDRPNTVYNLCGWGQKPDSKLFNHNSDEGTELSTALWFAWGELLSRPEPRKIAIIFSDGGTNYDDTDPTRAAILRMKKDGIETVGIGIKDENLKRDYLPNDTQIINDLNQLTPALLKLLKEKLVDAA